MWNLNHDAGTVARLVARLGTAVFHVLQHFQCIVHQLVALAAVDVYDHSYAARIVLVFLLVKPLVVPALGEPIFC